MERAGRLIGSLRVPKDALSYQELASRAWPAALGKRLAHRTWTTTLVGTRLVVQVEDAVWQRQLYTLRHQLLANLERLLGRGIVESLEFRVQAPAARRPPQRESGPAVYDESTLIRDPILRKLYVASRKRESA
jgi:hypothetical protein